MISATLQRHRLAIVRLCCCALLLLGGGAQLHGLAHALQAAQAAIHHDPATSHAQACEQCLQYAAIDGALPAPVSATPTPWVAAEAHREARTPLHAATFVAFRSRAPPSAG